MIDFKRIIHSKAGKYLISIILGLGLASLFRRACHDRKCYKFIGPPLEKVEDKICFVAGNITAFEQRPIGQLECVGHQGTGGKDKHSQDCHKSQYPHQVNLLLAGLASHVIDSLCPIGFTLSMPVV